MANLVEFTEEPVCCKCGAREVNWAYREEVRYRPIGRYGPDEEHIEVLCRRCKHEWYMRVKHDLARM